jgi:hypothetical protein
MRASASAFASGDALLFTHIQLGITLRQCRAGGFT